MFIGISLWSSGWLKVAEKLNWKNVIILLAGLAIVLLTKIYVAAVLVICSLFLPLKFLIDNKLLWLMRLTFWALVVFVTWYGLHNGFCEKVIDKRNEFIALSVNEHSGSVITTQPVAADCSTLTNLVPSAIINAVLKPFVWQKGNMFEMLFGIENMCFIVALVALLAFCFKRPRGEKLLLMLFCLFFALLNYLSIGITVPIMGAIVHYRIVATPFLLLSVLLMIDLEKLKARFNSLFRFSI